MTGIRQIPNSVKAYTVQLWRYANARPIFLWAQAIAFKSLVVIVPGAAIAIGLLGPSLARMIRNAIPDAHSGSFIELLESLQQVGDSMTVLGAIGLVFVAVTLFSTLRAVMAGVFEPDPDGERSILRGYLFDLRMAAQIGLFFLLSLGLSFGLQALNISDPEFLSRIGLDTVWIRTGWRRAAQAVGFIVPALLSGAVFYQLYYFVPPSRPKPRSALTGAVFAVILWELAKVGFAIYASRTSVISRYSDGGGSFGDVFGIIIAFVFWAYYSGVILILGAFVAVIHGARRRELERAEREAESNE